LNIQLDASDATVAELEKDLAQVTNESVRLDALLEESSRIVDNFDAPSVDANQLQQTMLHLEREFRVLSCPSKPIYPSQKTGGLRDEILTTKEQLAELTREIKKIASHSSLSSSHPSSRDSPTEHHHHHYYYPLPEFRLTQADSPIHSKFFHELPTPPSTASARSSVSLRDQRFNSYISSLRHVDNHSNLSETGSERPRRLSRESVLSSTSNVTLLCPIDTPTLRRSTSHESIFEPTPFSPSSYQSPRSPSLSSSASTSPTYLSASAHLRQNNMSPLLLLSSARGKQSLSSKKSFWNMWDKSPRTTKRPSMLRNVSNASKNIVLCTEVDLGMLEDALKG
jgi:hypothetical protein